MKSVISVELPNQTYSIGLSPQGLDDLGVWLVATKSTGRPLGKKVLLVSNATIFRHYGQRAITSLTQAGFDVDYCLLPPGERYKTLTSVQKLYDAALRLRLERSSTLVALGGGVIGDMTGFAAATWLRGVNVVQVPTSLLAMVDAAIGGKTGVNHPQGKNLIGAFHQPRLVLIDSTVLKTLPAREFRAGMAEVIKYGVIWDAGLFAALEASPRLDRLAAVNKPVPTAMLGQGGSDLAESDLPPTLLELILRQSCQAKAHVVSQDEKEAGLRAILNYGHTIGHAVESLTGYKRVNHGEAVAIGMVAAGHIAVALNLWDASAADRQLALIQKAGLPTQLPTGMDIEAIITSLQTDKKVQDGKVRFVLPIQIGAATVTDQVPAAVIRQVLQPLQPNLAP